MGPDPQPPFGSTGHLQAHLALAITSLNLIPKFWPPETDDSFSPLDHFFQYVICASAICLRRIWCSPLHDFACCLPNLRTVSSLDKQLVYNIPSALSEFDISRLYWHHNLLLCSYQGSKTHRLLQLCQRQHKKNMHDVLRFEREQSYLTYHNFCWFLFLLTDVVLN